MQGASEVNMKAIIRTIIVVLLIAAVAGIGWVSYGFREWDPDVWKEEIEDLTEEQPVVDGDGNVLDPDGVNPLPSAMTFSSALNLAGEETSVTVQATFTPSTAHDEYKKVDWSVAWKDASSDWAHGKTVTNYVTVTPTADGSATATIACKQAFGEQIVLTCASRIFPAIKATTTIDYRARITKLNVVYTTTRPPHITEDRYPLNPIYEILVDSSKTAIYIGEPTISREVHYPGEFYTDAWRSGWTFSSPEIEYSVGSIGKENTPPTLIWEVNLNDDFVQAVSEYIDGPPYSTPTLPLGELESDWTRLSGVSFAEFFHINANTITQNHYGVDPVEVAGTNRYLSECNDNTENFFILWQLAIHNVLADYMEDHEFFCQVRITARFVKEGGDYENEEDLIYSYPMTFDVGFQNATDSIDYITSIDLDNSAIVF